MISRTALPRIVAAEFARTSAFVLLVVLVAALGLRLCMAPVAAALSARFALPGIPDWSPLVWLLLGGPWLLFMIFAISVQLLEGGIMGLLAAVGCLGGFAVANMVYCASLPMRVRKRMFDEHGGALVTAALAGLPAPATAESLGPSLQARLLELGLSSYVLRDLIVGAALALDERERLPATIVRSCHERFGKRAHTVRTVIIVALLCSGAAMLALGFGAPLLWPPRQAIRPGSLHRVQVEQHKPVLLEDQGFAVNRGALLGHREGRGTDANRVYADGFAVAGLGALVLGLDGGRKPFAKNFARDFGAAVRKDFRAGEQ